MQEPLHLPLWALSAMGWSTSCLEVALPTPRVYHLGCARSVRGTRGSFETVLADEDEEQDMDRWYGSLSPTVRNSLSGRGISGWSWANSALQPNCVPPNLPPQRRVEAPSTDEPEPAKASLPAVVYGPPQWARPS